MSDVKVIDARVGPARLRRSNRKTLAISVLPDGSLELVAPSRAPIDDILARVQKRSTWIYRQQRTFAGMNADRTTRRYVSGATQRYLGRQYRLKIMCSASPRVRLIGAYLRVETPDASEEQVQRLVESWMREQARRQFVERLQNWKSWCERRKWALPKLTIRQMPKRWGSAQPSGRISLNPELVRAPSLCIDYVIAHEICHLRHHHHSKSFFKELECMFPLWQQAKQRLEEIDL